MAAAGLGVAGVALTVRAKGNGEGEGAHHGGDPYARALHKPPVPGGSVNPRGDEEWISSTCMQCNAGCGIRGRVIDGRLVKLEGHPDHPINRGSLGPKGQSGVEVLYHRDRLKTAYKRSAKGGALEAIPWDQAIAEIGGALKKLRDSGAPQGLLLLDGDPRGPMNALWQRFARAYGTPNHVDHRATSDAPALLANVYMAGASDLPAYDWSRARYVLGLGAALFESWCQTMHAMQASGELRQLPGQRVKFVHVSPRFSNTAAKADEWLDINPGTHGALALGLGHLLVKNGLYDKDFVAQHTFGFEPWKDAQGKEHQGYRQLLEAWDPKRVAEVTGVAEEDQQRIAQEMVEFKPALVMGDENAAGDTNGLPTAMAIHALNALLGNLERPGGVLLQQRAPLKDWAAVTADAAATAGLGQPRLDGAGTPAAPLALSRVQALPDALLGKQPYEAKAVFLYRSNPVFSKPDSKKWREALAKAPLVVSFAPLPDESTQLADYVLPDHTYLERWELVEPAPSRGVALLGLRQPVVPPQLDTRQTGDVLLAIAKAVGGPVADAFPWETFKEALEERAAGLSDDAEGTLEEMAEKSVWISPDAYAYEKWDTAFATPSRKFEFFPQLAQKRLEAAFPAPDALDKAMAAAGVQRRGDDLLLPQFELATAAGDAKEFPFLLLPYRGTHYTEGGVRHQRRLVEAPPYQGGNPYLERVQVSPQDASQLGVENDDKVALETPAGQRELHVTVSAGVRPGTLVLPLGYGQWPPKPGEEAGGGWTLLANHGDPLSGIFALHGTRARVRRMS